MSESTIGGNCIHIVTLDCRDAEHARQCLDALGDYGKPDALAFGCLSYEFGLKTGSQDVVILVERWSSWHALDTLLSEKVVPALPLYNSLLLRDFDPGRDTVRVEVKS